MLSFHNHLVDPSALERGANALKALDASPNARMAFELTKLQELTRQQEIQREIQQVTKKIFSYNLDNQKQLAKSPESKGKREGNCYRSNRNRNGLPPSIKPSLKRNHNLIQRSV